MNSEYQTPHPDPRTLASSQKQSLLTPGIKIVAMEENEIIRADQS